MYRKPYEDKVWHILVTGKKPVDGEPLAKSLSLATAEKVKLIMQVAEEAYEEGYADCQDTYGDGDLQGAVFTTKDSTQEAPKDVVAYSEMLGYRNYMYLPQELKNAIAKAYKHYRTIK